MEVFNGIMAFIMEGFRRKTLIAAGSLLAAFAFFVGGFYASAYFRYSPSNSASAAEALNLAEFWEVLDVIQEKYVAKDGTTGIDRQELVYGAIRGMVEALGDPYTTYFDPEENEEFKADISGTFEGAGMEIGKKDDVITVIAPLKNSPAEKAGMRTGDLIIRINDKSTIGMAVDEAVTLIRGPKGTEVKLGVVRDGTPDPFDVTIVRDKIDVPTVETKDLEDGVFVIRLFSFNQQSTRLFKQALKEFVVSKSDKLVLDLRGNPGGYLDSAVEISSWFLPAGKTVVSEDFGSSEQDRDFRSKGYELFNDQLKMVVLVDGGSASASEIVAGALQDHGIAKLVGSQTFGKGSVQELVDISDETSLKVTVARWLTPNGKSISENGLAPDFEVKFDQDRYIEEGKDNQLEKAIEVLKEM